MHAPSKYEDPRDTGNNMKMALDIKDTGNNMKMVPDIRKPNFKGQ